MSIMKYASDQAQQHGLLITDVLLNSVNLASYRALLIGWQFVNLKIMLVNSVLIWATLVAMSGKSKLWVICDKSGIEIWEIRELSCI